MAATARLTVPAVTLACGPDVYGIRGAPSVIMPDGRTKPTPQRLAFFEHAYRGNLALHRLIMEGVTLPFANAGMPTLWVREPPLSSEDAQFRSFVEFTKNCLLIRECAMNICVF